MMLRDAHRAVGLKTADHTADNRRSPQATLC